MNCCSELLSGETCFKSFLHSFQLKYSSSSSEEHQFVRGIPIYTISQIVDRMTSGTGGPPRLINGLQRPMPCIRILEVELYPTLLSKARSFGLSDAWIQVICYFCWFLFLSLLVYVLVFSSYPFLELNVCFLIKKFTSPKTQKLGLLPLKLF